MLNTFETSATRQAERDKQIATMEQAAADLGIDGDGGGHDVPRTIGTGPSAGQSVADSGTDTVSSSVQREVQHAAPSEAIENARQFLWDSDPEMNAGLAIGAHGTEHNMSGTLNDVDFDVPGTGGDSSSVGPGVDGNASKNRAPRRGRRKARTGSGTSLPSGCASTGDITETVGGLFGSAPSRGSSADSLGVGYTGEEETDKVAGRPRGKMPGRGSMGHTTMFQQPPTLYKGQYGDEEDHDDNGGVGVLRSGINNVGSAISSGFTNIMSSLGGSSRSLNSSNGNGMDFNRNMAPRRPSGDPLDYAAAMAKMQGSGPPEESTFQKAKVAIADAAYGCSYAMRECAASTCYTIDGMKKPLLAVAAAAILIGIVVLSGSSIQAGGDAKKGAGASLSSPADNQNVDLDRLTAIQARILGAGVSDQDALDEIGTPQYQAIRWLTATDEAKLAPDDPYIVHRYALAVFFFATYVTSEMEDRAGLPSVSDPNVSPGSEWKVVHNWMSGKGYCSWSGIECHKDEEGSKVYDANAGVTHLNLTQNNVRGYLPNELGALIDLRVMDMGQNGLTGTIPSSLAGLPLTTLYLGDNDLTGFIPTELGELKELSHLYLDRNVLRGGVPEEFAELENLQLVGMHENYLEGPLPDMSKWTKLRALYLDDNELSGTLSPSMGAMVNLVDLRLSGNRFYSSVPSEIGNMVSLEEIYIQQNSLSGSLPTEMSKLTSLREMQLYDNRIEGQIPADMFANMPKLEVFYLDHNFLSGPLPTSWGCKELRHLYVQNNKLESSLPEDLGNLPNLMSLRLNDNAFTSTIPESLGKLESLDHFYVHNNQMEGEIPSSLAGLKSLEKMRLHGNQFQGAVPPEICQLNLVELQSDCAGDTPEVTCDCCTECF